MAPFESIIQGFGGLYAIAVLGVLLLGVWRGTRRQAGRTSGRLSRPRRLEVITAALVRHAGRRSAAAIELGLTRQGLTKALRRLGLAVDEDAAGVA